MTISQNDFLYIPNSLKSFLQTKAEQDNQGRIILSGKLVQNNINEMEQIRSCPVCGKRTLVNNQTTINIRHLAFGGSPTVIRLTRAQYHCPHCNHSHEAPIPFKARHHFLTTALQHYIEALLTTNLFTLTAIHKLTHIHTEIIKDIDKHRLEQKYQAKYDSNGRVQYCYRKTSHYTTYIGVDEFSLHKHHQYATIIVDLVTGEVLFVAYGRKKQVIYDFMRVFGDNFMRHVTAIATDMNSDYAEAFKEKYPTISIIYDHFHIVKNFNEEVITKVRNDEYARLWKEGKWQEASLLKKSKYILMANYENLSEKGQQRLEAILKSNKLLLTADIVKEQLRYAYTLTNTLQMTEVVHNAIELCRGTKDKHFLWFAKLLESHLDGIILHAKYPISTGKVEGTNNEIKTMRRQAYGFHDDVYFFLKILDSTEK